MRGNGGGGVDAGGADGGIGVSEATCDGGEEFGEMGREGVAVGYGEERDKVEALLSDGGFVGGVSGGDGGEERRDGVVGEGLGDGF